MLEQIIKRVAENNKYINRYNAQIDELRQEITQIASKIANPYACDTLEQFVSDTARIAELYAEMQEDLEAVAYWVAENKMYQEDIAELESEV